MQTKNTLKKFNFKQKVTQKNQIYEKYAIINTQYENLL